jgi:hypothetical protein
LLAAEQATTAQHAQAQPDRSSQESEAREAHSIYKQSTNAQRRQRRHNGGKAGGEW